MSITTEWAIKTLDELAERIDYGHTASADRAEVGPKFLRITDIQNGHVDWNTVPHCPATPDELDKYRLRDGDIVFARTGNTTGKSFLLKEPPKDAVFASYLIRVRPSRSVDSRFLAHFFDTPNYWNQIEKNAQGAGQPGVNATRLKTLEIPLPPLPEQKRIADILDKADAIRRKRQEVTKELASLPVAAFDEIFGSPSSKRLDLPTVELKELIPSGDKINYGIVQPGKDVADGVPVVRVGDLQQLHVSLDGLKRVDPLIDQRHAKSRLIGDEILVACVGSIGLVALADDRLNGFNIVRAIARIRCNERVTREYLAAYLSTPAVQNYFTRSTRTVSQPTLNIKHIEETPILVPPMELQERFTQLVCATSDATNRSSAAVSEADGLFASLVQRAFKGAL